MAVKGLLWCQLCRWLAAPWQEECPGAAYSLPSGRHVNDVWRIYRWVHPCHSQWMFKQDASVWNRDTCIQIQIFFLPLLTNLAVMKVLQTIPPTVNTVKHVLHVCLDAALVQQLTLRWWRAACRQAVIFYTWVENTFTEHWARVSGAGAIQFNSFDIDHNSQL